MKKKCSNHEYVIRIMKITLSQMVLILILTSFGYARDNYAQGILNKRISLHVEENQLKYVLDELEKQAEIKFIYSESYLQLDSKVSLAAENEKLSKVLDNLLSPRKINFEVKEHGYVILKPIKSVKNTLPEPTSAYEAEVSLLTKYRPRQIIKGKVVDPTDEALPGVNIIKKNTQIGTVTDAEGNYSIEASASDTLVFSFIGYEAKEVAVGNQSIINVQLSEGVETLLDQVVVVGYGTQEKVNLTGAISTIDADKELNWKPVGQVSVALQGTMPGVTVTQSSGQPGSDQGTIRIRGIGTLNDNDPLVLVDGVQMSINDIDANDIEDITVLKDAAASSIYGVRAANGVILVTTKRGSSEGKPKVNYSGYYGVQNPTNMSEFLGAQDFMLLMNQTYLNSGGSAIYTDEDIAAYDNPNRNTDLYPDNDWANLILTGSGAQQQHSISLSGGSKDVKYRFSTNYFNQKGLVTNMDFNRITTRLNTDINVTEKISFSADLSARISNRTEPQDVGAGSSWFQFQSVNNSPLTVNQYSDGTWGTGIVRYQMEGGEYNYSNNLITGNFRADYNILPSLKLSGLASVNYTTDFNSLHTREMVFYDFFTTPHEVLSTTGNNSITNQYADNWFQNFQGFADYATDFGNHSVHVLAGISSLSRSNQELTGFRNNIPNRDLQQIDAGASDGQTTSGTANEYALLSYFGRVNYTYDDRYLLEANVRRDGSSRFPGDQRWGIFPSFSAGWRISSESFMQSQNFVDELKIRGSWGVLGNDNTNSNYPYQSTYSFASSYPFGGSLSTAALLSAYPSSILSWETTEMWDVGLDVTTLEGKLDITLDYYVKNTNDILLQLPIPLTTGLSAPYVNAGSVENRGWEFSANYNDRVGNDFEYNIGFNIADVQNEITDMEGGDFIQSRDDIFQAYYQGLPIGSFYGYEAVGLFQSVEDVNNSATQATGTTAGDIQYRDQDGNGVIDDGDRVFIGSPIPRYTYAINLSASYKGFDLNALLQGVGEQDIYTRNMDRAPTSNSGNFKAIHQDSWTEENTDATFPRLSTGTQNYVSSSYWIRSGSYLRLKSLQLGYSLPQSLLESIGISSVRIYASASNLFTITSLEDGIDPEAPNDNRYYPQTRVMTVGLNLNL